MNETMTYAAFKAEASRVVDALLFVMIAAPIVCLLPLYVATLGAFFRLGHWPIPHQDPCPFHGITFGILYWLSGAIFWLSLIGPPVVLPLWRFLNPHTSFRIRVLLSTLALTAAFTLLTFDPGDIISWWLDWWFD